MPVDQEDQKEYERLVGRPRENPTEPDAPVVADERAAKEARDDMQRRRLVHRMHGAQSDQGGEGQKLYLGSEQDDVYEGPEESNQQRR